MAGTQVVLTFAGETKNLEEGFNRVGDSSKRMSDKVGESSDGFRKAGEAADEVDTKAMGFRDTMTGVQDTMKGTSQIAKGDLFNGFLTLGMGIGDLGSGFYNFLIPALQKTKIATLASAAGSKIAAGASRVWAAGQWLLNTALLASPITWVIVGIVALVAVVVLIATKTRWFQTAWRVAWSGIRSAASNAWNFIRQIPGWIGRAFSRVAGAISSPFRAAFNFIASAWNNTVGRLSFTFPGWIPGIGGNSISVPHLPHFHSGGVVPGTPGSEQLAVLQAGERVTPASGARGGGEQWIRVDLGELGDALLQPIAKAVSRRGGQVTHLGVRVVNGVVRA
jgi:hypothetical protein